MRYKNNSLLLCVAVAVAFPATLLGQGIPGPFEKQLRTDNPLREAINILGTPLPAVVDYDKDGDSDIILADYYNGRGMVTLRNDGTKTTPAFNYTSSYAQNPFYEVAYSLGAAPAFNDLDGDGDPDMLLGNEAGTILCYLNSGATISPYVLQNSAWNPATRVGNPFHGIDLGAFTKPVFTDFDGDGDKDVVVGVSFATAGQSVYYYENDGTFTFTQKPLTGIAPPLAEVAPAVLDVDGDGLKDIITGAIDGNIRYFRRTGATAFTEQTGNANPFNTFSRGENSAPVATDLDDDGDMDLIIGAEHAEQNLFYFENSGNGNFIEKKGLSSPVGGINVSQESVPVFANLDNDPQPELILGGFSSIKYYKEINGVYEEQITNPFAGLGTAILFVPTLVDLDGDGDKDLVGGQENGAGTSIEYFRNDNGTFIRQDFSTGPFKNITVDRGKTEFGDIDNDGDFDFFISQADEINYVSTVRYFRNTGTATNPAFTELTGNQNPLGAINEMFALYPRLADMDHDGDLDMVIGEGGNLVENEFGNKFMYYENTGTPSNPQFVLRANLINRGNSPLNPAPSFLDYDNDGDLDILMGGRNGYLTLFKNTNPAATVAFSKTAITTAPNTKVTLDDQVTLTDGDDDIINRVTVAIAGYEQNKQVLSFTESGPITGTFDVNTGILTLTGKATSAAYQDVLRTVAFEYTGNNLTASVTKTIEARAFDLDGTLSVVAQLSVTADVTTVPPPASEEVIVYNAVAPNSTGDNHYMRITNLPDDNQVSIFNRWGDRVFSADNYNDENTGKRFEGRSDNGGRLPSGTYFYKIEYRDASNTRKTLTGYLTLIQ